MILGVTYGEPDVSSGVISERSSNLEWIDHDRIGTLVPFVDEVRFSTHGRIDSKPVVEVKWRYAGEGFFFGLGDKVGPMDRRGRRYVFWNTDNFTHHPSADPLYKSFPFYIFVPANRSGKVHGCFTDHPGWLEIDLDSGSEGSVTFRGVGRGFNQYIVVAEHVADVVRALLELTGSNVALPMWALGYQQSRWSYSSQGEVLQIARTFRDRDIPCDVIYLDIDYFDAYKVFTWNPSGFPNPRTMIGELHDMGFKVVSILDPGVKVESGYDVYEEGKGRFFLKNVGGDDFEGAVWPGRVRFPDFLDPQVRRWWASLARRYLDDGIDGFWNDMNEPSVFATDRDLELARKALEVAKLEDGVKLAAMLNGIGEIGRRGHEDEILHLDGTPHWKVRNIYGLNMQRAVAEVIQEENRRPFLITRSAFAGVQKYGGVWTGDNHSWWEHILQETVRLNSLSVCGVFYSGCDVGGFGGDASAELLIRFTQFGAFTPMFRNHSAIGTRRQEPWAFGPQVENILRSIIKLRYSLIPYIYTQYMLGVLNDRPLMRPMWFDYGEPEALEIEDQYMFGDSLIVAPIYRPNVRRRAVWFPQRARHIVTGEILRRGWRIVDAPLETPCVFQIDGTAVPRVEPRSFIDGYGEGEITWNVFGSKTAIGYLYEDDGVSLDYRNGRYNLKKVIVQGESIEVETLHRGFPVPERWWEFLVHDAEGRTSKVRVRVGDELRYSFSIHGTQRP